MNGGSVLLEAQLSYSEVVYHKENIRECSLYILSQLCLSSQKTGNYFLIDRTWPQIIKRLSKAHANVRSKKQLTTKNRCHKWYAPMNLEYIIMYIKLETCGWYISKIYIWCNHFAEKSNESMNSLYSEIIFEKLSTNSENVLKLWIFFYQILTWFTSKF